jgi:hypothetical protein
LAADDRPFVSVLISGSVNHEIETRLRRILRSIPFKITENSTAHGPIPCEEYAFPGSFLDS